LRPERPHPTPGERPHAGQQHVVLRGEHREQPLRPPVRRYECDAGAERVGGPSGRDDPLPDPYGPAGSATPAEQGLQHPRTPRPDQPVQSHDLPFTDGEIDRPEAGAAQPAHGEAGGGGDGRRGKGHGLVRCGGGATGAVVPARPGAPVEVVPAPPGAPVAVVGPGRGEFAVTGDVVVRRAAAPGVRVVRAAGGNRRSADACGTLPDRRNGGRGRPAPGGTRRPGTPPTRDGVHQLPAALPGPRRMVGDPAVAQYGHRVRQALDLRQQMRDVHDGEPLAPQVLHPGGERVALGAGQRGRGFVQDQDRGAAAEGLGDLDQLPLTHGEFAHPVAGRAARGDAVEEFGGDLLLGPAVDTAVPGPLLAEEDVLGDGQGVHDAQRLEDDRHPGRDRLARAQPAVRDTAHLDRPGVGRKRAAEALDQGGLPGPVVAEEGVDLPRGHGQIHPVQCPHSPEGLAQGHDPQVRRDAGPGDAAPARSTGGTNPTGDTSPPCGTRPTSDMCPISLTGPAGRIAQVSHGPALRVLGEQRVDLRRVAAPDQLDRHLDTRVRLAGGDRERHVDDGVGHVLRGEGGGGAV
ncbi:hypothetical protein STRIP9103_08913, partial [Streptomyces ipomoeae 91-03]